MNTDSAPQTVHYIAEGSSFDGRRFSDLVKVTETPTEFSTACGRLRDWFRINCKGVAIKACPQSSGCTYETLDGLIIGQVKRFS